ncbi:MAG: glycosyltransferase [Eubacteriales bacterium]|nr:glycosyltransferase [Eubacteriales bacterium]
MRLNPVGKDHVTDRTGFPELSIVIPTFGRDHVLADHVMAIRQQVSHDFAKTASKAKAANFEIIIVDDCSQDHSAQVITQLCADYPDVRGLLLAKNVGQQHATLAGLRASRGSVVITMDDDGKDRPQDLVRLTECLTEGFDVVYGVPTTRLNKTWYRRFGTRLKELVMFVLCHKPIHIELTGFRAMTREMVDRVCHDTRKHVYISASLLQNPIKIGQINIPAAPDACVQSGYTFFKRARVLLLLAFSYSPLQGLAGPPACHEQYVIQKRLNFVDGELDATVNSCH